MTRGGGSNRPCRRLGKRPGFSRISAVRWKIRRKTTTAPGGPGPGRGPRPDAPEAPVRTRRREDASPLNRPARDRFFGALAVVGLAWLLHLLGADHGPVGAAIVGLVLLGAWGLTVWFLLLETRFRIFWIAWVAAAAVIVILFPGVRGIATDATMMTFAFLALRKYRPFRHLSSRQKAAAFGLVVLAGLATFLFWWPSGPSARLNVGGVPVDAAPPAAVPAAGAGFARPVTSFALWSLRLFLLFALFHLFFRVRLHFMRIRPKLAVSALLLAGVPAVLLLAMSAVVLFSALGESQAVRARSLLTDWAGQAARSEAAMDAAFAGRFAAGEAGLRPAAGTPGAPPWTGEILSALAADARALVKTAGRARADYVWKDGRIWLVRYDPSAAPGPVLSGAPVDGAVLSRLASIVGAEVRVSTHNPVAFEEMGRSLRGAGRAVKFVPAPGEIVGRYEPRPAVAAGPASLLRRRMYFGMSDFEVLAFDATGFRAVRLLLILRASPAEVFEDLYSARNPMGLAILVGLGFAGVLLLLLEAAGVVFALRIVGGITSGLKALGQGTRRIAAGRFDQPTVIPNEDELGDLAAAFNDMAVAVETGRREAVEREKLERELKVAREIQENLLPHEMPRVPGFEVSGTSLPSLQVSGDYFDFLLTPDGRLDVAVADVSGKGIPAALLMANLQAGWRGQAAGRDTAAAVARMNDLLARSTDAHMFATFFYGALDRRAGTVSYTNAGHNPPVLARADGTTERLEPTGLLLGFMPGQSYEERTVAIRPGDALVLFTDGVTEAARPEADAADGDRYFGDERLIATVRGALAEGAAGIQRAVLDAVAAFTGGLPLSDDVTLVVIKRTSAA